MFFKKKEDDAFISYRNIKVNETYPNYNLASLLGNLLIYNKHCIDIRIAAPSYFLPEGALLSPSNIFDFLYTTITNLDHCKHFIILDKDYFIEDSIEENDFKKCFTSMWTEAEVMLWKYHSKKERKIFCATYKNSDFDLKEVFIKPLERNVSKVLASIIVNLTPTFRHVPYNWGPLADHKLMVCKSCNGYFLVDLKVVLEKAQSNSLLNCPYGCGNNFSFHKIEKNNKSFWISKQRDNPLSPISIYKITGLLLLKDLPKDIKIVKK